MEIFTVDFNLALKTLEPYIDFNPIAWNFSSMRVNF